jgi:hypothetical protein
MIDLNYSRRISKELRGTDRHDVVLIERDIEEAMSKFARVMGFFPNIEEVDDIHRKMSDLLDSVCDYMQDNNYNYKGGRYGCIQ